MPIRVFILIGAICLALVVPASGALYEFKLQGKVTGVFPELGVNTGDKCTISYFLDSTDSNPSPLVGRYRGSHAILEFPNTTFIGDPANGGGLVVTAGSLGSDLVGYQNGATIGGEHFSVQISFAFPNGTLASDALPLELPLHLATTSYFDLAPTIHPILVGTITSYSAVPVPEPSATLTVLLMTTLARRCARQQ